MRKKNIKKLGTVKAVIMTVSIMLVMCCVISGTVAWLITRTEPVINTFTYGDINISISESDTGDGDSDPLTNTYNMVPGKDILKDPSVTVEKNSEDSWLFVKLEKSVAPAQFDAFMEYAMADGWIALSGNDGVFYREVAKSDADQTFYVIKDNTVKVKGDVTKEMLNALTEMPTLKITAYAVQRDAAIEDINTAAEAWALIK
ncbi:MAG: hypothetical protein U0L72_09170 [Acutalibacteraceae bacterium]|nr:hypothetical protein [Acutalibacteraceae bacterium]